jgi:carboxymethylenebutenolidase
MLTGRVFGKGLGAILLAGMVLSGGCDSGSENTAAPTQEVPAPTAPTAASPTPAKSVGETQRDVVSDRLPYGEVGDELVYGYFVFPSDMIEPLPAVVVIHEWWGLTDEVRSMCDRLAAEGFIVLAVDLFGGETGETPGAARTLMAPVVEDPDTAAHNISSAVDFVQYTAGAPRIGVLGFGLGGGLVLDAAIDYGDDLDAAVIYYGAVTSDQGKLLPISAPLLGLFGDADRAVSKESVEKFRAAMQTLRKNFEVVIYPDAGTDFASPQSQNYDAALVETAWQKSLQFLQLHLSVDGST